MRVGLLNRYIMTTVLKAMLVVLMIAVAVDIFIQLANEVGDAGKGSYSMAKAMLYVPMVVPNDIYSFFPMIGLLGSLVGLGLLSSTSELMVMRAASFSVGAIVRSVFYASIMLCFCMVIIGECFAPKLLHFAEVYKQKAVLGQQSIETQRGVWVHVNDDFLRIENVIDKSELLGVTRYHFNAANQLLSESHAERMLYKNEQWVAYDVETTKLDTYPIEAEQAESQVWVTDLKPSAFAFGFDEPRQMSMVKLFHFAQYRKAVGLPSSQYLLVFWQRVFQPFAMLVMVLLAVPFVFGMARSSSMGFRVVIGVIAGLGFYLVNQFMGQFSILYQAPAWLAALLPVGIFFIIGLCLLRRVK